MHAKKISEALLAPRIWWALTAAGAPGLVREPFIAKQLPKASKTPSIQQ